MKKIIIALVLILMSISLVACSSSGEEQSTVESDLAYVKEKGNIVVGVTDFEPMDYPVNGEWTGFDAELAKLVGEKLGVEVVFQEIEWNLKETELAGKTIDVIWNGLTWSQDRAANMEMSDYYMLNKQVLAVREADVEKFKNISDFDGVNVTAEAGSAGEEFILADMSNADYIESESQKYALMELLSGNADGAVLDYTMAYYLFNAADSDFSSLAITDGVIETSEEYYAIACRKGSDLCVEINRCLAELKADGTVTSLASQYGLEGSIVE